MRVEEPELPPRARGARPPELTESAEPPEPLEPRGGSRSGLVARAPVGLVSASSSSGRRFSPTVEAMLHPVLRDLAVRLPGAAGREAVLFEEFEGPWGVPDLVALLADRKALAARRASGVMALTGERDCHAVTAVRSRWLPEDVVAELSDTSGRAGRRRVARLAEAGALQRDQRGRVRATPGIAPLGRVWALEAKVDAWRAGLGQAQRYRLWADGAVLVLERMTSSREVLLERAREFRVGVWAGGAWLLRPRLAPPSPARRLWASEHAWAALTRAEAARATSALTVAATWGEAEHDERVGR